MDMFKEMLSGMIDKEGETKKVLNAALIAFAKEYRCMVSDVVIMIKGENDEKDDCRFSLKVYIREDGKPVPKKEITVKDITG